MPEGDSVHKVAAHLRPQLVGQPLVTFELRDRGTVEAVLGKAVQPFRGAELDVPPLGGTDGGTGDPDDTSDSDGLDVPAVAVSSMELVYERRWGVSEEGEILEPEVTGAIDLATWQAVARPWTHTAEPWSYAEEAVTRVSATGETVSWYRVRRTPNTEPLSPALEIAAPPEVREDVAAAVDAAEGGRLVVNVKVRNHPQWDIPLVPREGVLTPGERALAGQQRASALLARAVEFDARAEPVIAAAEALGASVLNRAWGPGWLSLEVTPSALAMLAARTDLRTIELDQVNVQPLSENLAEIRSRVGADVEPFWDSGHYGQTGSRVMSAAILEEWHINDDVCFLDENAGCTPTRLRKIFECPLGCIERSKAVYDWVSSGEDVAHGTGVASMLAADYVQDQADGYDVCDPNCTTPPCTHELNSFEERASAFAKEAVVDYYDMLGSASSNSHVDAVLCAQGIGTGCVAADLINNSNSFANPCSATSSTFLEDALEDAFDDGLLVVSGAGNVGTTGSTCNLVSPADTPKVLTINGIDLRTDDYASAPIHSTQAAIGGGNIEVPNGTLRSGALAFVDLSAPSHGILYSTTSSTVDPDSPPSGCVVPAGSAFGTSAATPIASSAALVLKAQLLDAGFTDVDSPGRLHAAMLLMGDRATTGGGYRGTGTDDRFGFGRLKMRLVEAGSPSAQPGGLDRRSFIFLSSSPDVSFVAFDAPIPTKAKLLKCVLLQDEDLSSRDNISRFKLKVQIRGQAIGGGCVGKGFVHATKTNSDYDHKKMVAFTDSTQNIEGNCAKVTVDRVSLNSVGFVAVQVACGYFSEVDNVPN